MKFNSLRGLFGQLSRRLDIMAAKSFEIEEAVAKLVENNGKQGLDFVEGLQSLDYLRQALEDTAVLCHLLKIHLPKDNDGPFDAVVILSKLKLQETQDILIKKTLDPSNLVKPVSGDIDLF